MRRILLSLLVLLTVFRGMVGDAMAMDMGFAPPTQSAINKIANQIDSTPASGHFDTVNLPDSQAVPPCHMAANTDSDAQGLQSKCSSCQVCHMGGCIPAALPNVVVAPAHEQPRRAMPLWASAERAGSFKPPVF